MISRILLPLDGSSFARAALQPAVTLAKAHQASIVVFGCLTLDEVTGSGVEMSPYTVIEIWDERKEELLNRLGEVVKEVQEEGLEADLVWTSGRPVEKIVEAAQEKSCDCIVMTSHGRSGFRRWMMGSVTEGVLRKAPCPVFVIPCGEK